MNMRRIKILSMDVEECLSYAGCIETPGTSKCIFGITITDIYIDKVSV